MSKVLEEAKLLATCLSYVKLEMGRFTSSINAKINELQIPQIDKDVLREELVESVFDRFSLPDSIVYQVHLDDLKKELKSNIDMVNEIASQKLDEEKFLSNIDDLNVLAKKFDFLKNEEQEPYQILVDNISRLEEKFDKAGLADTIREDVDRLNDLIEATTNTINEKIVNNKSVSRELFDKLSEDVTSEIENQIVVFNKYINSQFETLYRDFNSHREYTEKTINSYADKIKELDFRVSQKSDINHDHPEYASAQHIHPDYANKFETENVLKTHGETLRKMSGIIADISSTLAKKANSTDILTSRDLSKMKKEITDELASKIKQPRDGHEWEFTFDQHDRGVLMYKRADQTVWKRQNIMGPPAPVQSARYFGGDGGPSISTVMEIVNSALANLTPSEEESMEYDTLIDVVDNITYIGKATPGTATSAPNWQIKRIEELADGDTNIKFANATNTFSLAWDDRAEYTY